MTQATIDTGEHWPLPSLAAQLAICALTFGACALLGPVGLAAAMLGAVLLPGIKIVRLWSGREYVGVVSVYLATLLVANIDALPLVFEQESGRWGLPLVLGTAGCVLLGCRQVRRECWPALILFGAVLALRILSALASEQAVEVALKQVAYFLALVLFVLVLSRRDWRRAWVEKLALLTAALAGQYLAELLNPGGQISISATRIDGVVGRAAGLYANPNNGGLILAIIALLVAFACEQRRTSWGDRLRLICFNMLCITGIGMTFSRQAILLFAAPLLIATWRLSGKDLRHVLLVFPLAGVLVLGAFFGAVELIDQSAGGLGPDARDRYLQVKGVLTFGTSAAGDHPVALSDRFDNWTVTEQYWADPTLFGLGYHFIDSFDPSEVPHNQILMLLIEDGLVGAGLFLVAVAVGTGLQWALSFRRAIECLVALYGFLVLVMGTYNLFDYRFFALSIATLLWVARAHDAAGEPQVGRVLRQVGRGRVRTAGAAAVVKNGGGVRVARDAAP